MLIKYKSCCHILVPSMSTSRSRLDSDLQFTLTLMPGKEVNSQHTHTYTGIPCQLITVTAADLPNAELICPSMGTAPSYPQFIWPSNISSALAAPFNWIGARRGDHQDSGHTACCCSLHAPLSEFWLITFFNNVWIYVKMYFHQIFIVVFSVCCSQAQPAPLMLAGNTKAWCSTLG